MITPTIGRVVWVFRPTINATQAEAGIVAYVHNERLINVAAFTHDGSPFFGIELPLLQDDDPKPEGDYATWMPYQIAQAAVPQT